MSDLTTNEFEQLVALEEMLADLSVEARRIADESGLSRRAIAEQMGHSSTSTVQRLVGGAAYNSTVETLARFAWACGFELEVQLAPRKTAKEEPAQDCNDVADTGARAAKASVYSFDAYRNAQLPQWSCVTSGPDAPCVPTEVAGARFVPAA